MAFRPSKQRARRDPTEIRLRPIRTNAGLIAGYRKRLESAVARMHRDVDRAIKASWRSDTPALTEEKLARRRTASARAAKAHRRAAAQMAVGLRRSVRQTGRALRQGDAGPVRRSAEIDAERRRLHGRIHNDPRHAGCAAIDG